AIRGPRGAARGTPQSCRDVRARPTLFGFIAQSARRNSATVRRIAAWPRTLVHGRHGDAERPFSEARCGVERGTVRNAPHRADDAAAYGRIRSVATSARRWERAVLRGE